MAILGNQGYRRDLNLGETESEIEVINNLGGAGIAADLRLIQNNLRNTSKIGFCTITDGFFNAGISTVIQLSELSKTIDESDSDLIDFTVTLDPPQYIEAGHQVEIRNILKSTSDTNQSVLNGFYYVNQVINDGQQYKFELPDGFKLGSEDPVIVNNATDGFSTVRITPRDTFTFTKDDVVGLSSDVTFTGAGATTLTKGRDYYVCDSDGSSKFKLSYFPSGYSSPDGSQVGIQTINVTGIDYTSSPTQFFTFIRKDIVTQENLINFIKPDEGGEGGGDDEGGFRFFRSDDDAEAYGQLNEIFVETATILDNTRFKLGSRYEKTKSISSTKDVKYEGSVIIKDPDNFNSGFNNVLGDNSAGSPGIFIAGTRAFSADNNPWTDEDEIVNPGTGIANAIVTKSFQVGVGEIVFHDTVSDPSTSTNDIRIDGLGSDIGTLTGTAGDYTHKLPVVINGETYFLLLSEA